MIGVVKGVFKNRDDGLCTADDVAKNWPTWHANCIKNLDGILTVFDVIPTGFHVILVPYDDVINWPTTSLTGRRRHKMPIDGDENRLHHPNKALNYLFINTY